MLVRRSLLALAAFVFTACASPEVQPELPRVEQLRVDNAIGEKIYPHYERSIALREDPEVTIFLRKVALRLLTRFPDLKSAPIGVRIIDDRAHPDRSFSLPGNRVYLPRALLKKMTFESEIAAAIAIELTHLDRRHRARQFEEIARRSAQPGAARLSPSEWAVSASREEIVAALEPLANQRLTESEVVFAVQTAIRTLYESGYDPRGVTSYLNMWSPDTAKGEYPRKWLDAAKAAAREAIVSYPPLRNPTVRTSEFVAIKKRIEQL